MASNLILAIILMILVISVVTILINGPKNDPTWTGIIVSALIGMLPLYLVLCFLGVMGDER